MMWNNDQVFRKPGHVQVLKRRRKETEFFHLWNYFLNEVVARQAEYYKNGGLGSRNTYTKRKVRQNSTTSGELLTELKHVKQLALEYTSTGIFTGQSQELDFTLSSLNTL
jgi:hypothetical protein